MLTKVMVTLDGRLLLQQGSRALELIDPRETAALLSALAEAWNVQTQIAGLFPGEVLRDERTLRPLSKVT